MALPALVLTAAAMFIAPLAGAQPAERAAGESPLPAAALERASEAGGWWVIAQSACDVGRGTAILDRMNAVLTRIQPPSRAMAVSARVQDPFLPDSSRLKMEIAMGRVTEMQAIAGDIRGIEAAMALAAKEMKPLPARIDRPEWKLAAPVTDLAGLRALRETTDQALSRLCAEGIGQLDALFVNAKTGILPLLR